jgi:hypothetical protein
LLKSFVTFWKGENSVPGVADQIRRTTLRQEHKSRQREMEELVAMVKEGRLHEADERQLETLKLVLELQKAFSNISSPKESSSDKEDLTEVIKTAISEALQNLPTTVVTKAGSGAEDPSRPQMRHTSLADFVHTTEEVSISHGDTLAETKEGEDGAGDKLDKLRKLKGGG